MKQMTREEASNILDDYDVNFEGHTAEEIAEAFDVAFRALEQTDGSCGNCEHMLKGGHDYPCSNCSNNYVNQWTPKKPSVLDKIRADLLAISESDVESEYLQAMRVAIKALDQEPVLDKIRAEIVDKAYKGFLKDDFTCLHEVIDIIDKYREGDKE